MQRGNAAARPLDVVAGTLALLLLVLTTGCSGDEDGTGSASAKVERTGDAVERGTEKAGSVAASPQRGDGKFVVVDEVVLPKGGYVVIYADGEGAPGQRLGVSKLLEPGPSTNTRIELSDEVDSGDVVHAMLHAEDNGDEDFDFPDHDAPIVAQGSIVEVPFEITVK